MLFDRKTKKDSNKTSNQAQDQWNGQEAVNWSSTEGYEEVRQVNNWLKWPSVWADHKAKASHEAAVSAKSSAPKSTIKKAESDHLPMVKKVEVRALVNHHHESGQAKKPEILSTSKPDKPAVKPEIIKPAAKQPSFWQRLFDKHSVGQLRRANKMRSRQIKQDSGGLPSYDDNQAHQANFQAKEERRRHLAETHRLAQRVPAPVAEKPAAEKAIERPVEKNQDPIVEKNINTPVVEQPTEPVVEKKATSQDNSNQQRLHDLRQRFEQKSWDRPTLTETNLVGGQTTLYFNWNKFWLVLTQWLVVTLFFLSLCGALLYLWQQRQNRQAADVTNRFSKINQLITLTENEVGGVLDFRTRLIMVNDMLSRHIYWNNFFSFLEKNTLPNVFYQDFTGTPDGEYVLRARTDSFDSMAKQIKVFRRSADVLEVNSEGGDMVKNEPDEKASSSEGVAPVTQLNFSIHLKIKPELFFR